MKCYSKRILIPRFNYRDAASRHFRENRVEDDGEPRGGIRREPLKRVVVRYFNRGATRVPRRRFSRGLKTDIVVSPSSR